MYLVKGVVHSPRCFCIPGSAFKQDLNITCEVLGMPNNILLLPISASLNKGFVKKRSRTEFWNSITRLEFSTECLARSEFANHSLDLLTPPLLAVRCPRIGGVHLLNAVPTFHLCTSGGPPRQPPRPRSFGSSGKARFQEFSRVPSCHVKRAGSLVPASERPFDSTLAPGQEGPPQIK